MSKFELDTTKIRMEFENELKGRYYGDMIYFAITTSAYIILKLQEKNIDECLNISDLIDNIEEDEEIRNILYKYSRDTIDVIKLFKGKYSNELLKSLVLSDCLLDGSVSGLNTTATSIIQLSNAILDIKESDDVSELCSGTGTFMNSNKDKMRKYTGIDINSSACDVSIIKRKLINNNYKIISENVLGYTSLEKNDKIFSNHPFMIKDGIDEYRMMIENELKISGLRRATSDWLFNAAIIKNLKNDGKAVSIMTNGSTWNNNDKEIRQEFLDKGYIETIISLPDKLLNGTMIPVTLVVLSFNNKTVNFVDATDICVKNRRTNELSDENIEKIMDLIGTETEISTVKTIEELSKKDYIINAQKHLEKPVIEGGVPLVKFIKSISRGATIKASDIDELSSQGQTDCRYIALSNIKNSILDFENDVQSLKKIPDNLKKYCLKPNSIILSKTGSPKFKSAIVPEIENISLLPTVNLIVLELDESKVYPLFVQAFFASSKGEKSLQSSAKGSAIATLSAESLKQTMIPDISLDAQREIAKKYLDTTNEIISLQKALDESLSKLNDLV